MVDWTKNCFDTLLYEDGSDNGVQLPNAGWVHPRYSSDTCTLTLACMRKTSQLQTSQLQ